jgi:hypothetical protein
MELAVRPVRALRDGVAQAGELLKTDCPTYRPVTPVVRIDVMEQRLDAMLRAINIVQPALQKFYGSLPERGIVTAVNVVDHVVPHRGDWTAFVTGEL